MNEQSNLLLAQALETEMVGVHVYQAARTKWKMARRSSGL
jgi:hypothetical protein